MCLRQRKQQANLTRYPSVHAEHPADIRKCRKRTGSSFSNSTGQQGQLEAQFSPQTEQAHSLVVTGALAASNTLNNRFYFFWPTQRASKQPEQCPTSPLSCLPQHRNCRQILPTNMKYSRGVTGCYHCFDSMKKQMRKNPLAPPGIWFSLKNADPDKQESSEESFTVRGGARAPERPFQLSYLHRPPEQACLTSDSQTCNVLRKERALGLSPAPVQDLRDKRIINQQSLHF